MKEMIRNVVLVMLLIISLPGWPLASWIEYMGWMQSWIEKGTEPTAAEKFTVKLMWSLVYSVYLWPIIIWALVEQETTVFCFKKVLGFFLEILSVF